MTRFFTMALITFSCASSHADIQLDTWLQIDQGETKHWTAFSSDKGGWLSIGYDEILLKVRPTVDKDGAVRILTEVSKDVDEETVVLASPTVTTHWDSPAEIVQSGRDGRKLRLKLVPTHIKN